MNEDNQEQQQCQRLPARSENSGCPSKKIWLNPLGAIAILLAIILAALILHNEKQERLPLELLPEQTLFFCAFSCDNETCNAIGNLPIWKDSQSSNEIIEQQWQSILEKVLGKIDQQVFQRLSGNIKSSGWAYTSNNKNSPIIILRCGNVWEAEQIFLKSISSSYNPAVDRSNVAGINEIKNINLREGGKAFMVVLKPYIVIVRDPSLLEGVIKAWLGEKPSLASSEFGIGNSINEKSHALFFARLQEFSQVCPRNPLLNNLEILSSKYLPSACVIAEAMFHGDSFVTQGRFVNIDIKSENNGEDTGVLHYILWTIATILIIVIGLPVLFILVTLLMAVYFHICSWWKGEVVPTNDPELPELSKEAKEDLGQEYTNKDN